MAQHHQKHRAKKKKWSMGEESMEDRLRVMVWGRRDDGGGRATEREVQQYHRRRYNTTGGCDTQGMMLSAGDVASKRVS